MAFIVLEFHKEKRLGVLLLSDTTLFIIYRGESWAVSYCGDLNRFGSHNRMCLNVWPRGRDTISRCGFVGGSVFVGRWALRSYIGSRSTQCNTQPSSCCLQIKMQNSQLLLQYHICLHATTLPTMMILDWTSETVSQPQLNVTLIMVSLHRSNKSQTHTAAILAICHSRVPKPARHLDTACARGQILALLWREHTGQDRRTQPLWWAAMSPPAISLIHSPTLSILFSKNVQT